MHFMRQRTCAAGASSRECTDLRCRSQQQGVHRHAVSMAHLQVALLKACFAGPYMHANIASNSLLACSAHVQEACNDSWSSTYTTSAVDYLPAHY